MKKEKKLYNIANYVQLKPTTIEAAQAGNNRRQQ